MQTIDERLSIVFNLINEKGKDDLFQRDEKDKEKIKETIEYLKDYAKMQTISKALSNQEGLKQNI